MPRTKKQQLLLSQQYQPLSNLLLTDGDDQYEHEDVDHHRSFSRPRVENQKDDSEDDDELSDYIKVRLVIARLKALKKYQEVWG